MLFEPVAAVGADDGLFDLRLHIIHGLDSCCVVLGEGAVLPQDHADACEQARDTASHAHDHEDHAAEDARGLLRVAGGATCAIARRRSRRPGAKEHREGSGELRVCEAALLQRVVDVLHKRHSICLQLLEPRLHHLADEVCARHDLDPEPQRLWTSRPSRRHRRSGCRCRARHGVAAAVRRGRGSRRAAGARVASAAAMGNGRAEGSIAAEHRGAAGNADTLRASLERHRQRFRSGRERHVVVDASPGERTKTTAAVYRLDGDLCGLRRLAAEKP
mmetsp:Transcript_66275/g.191300  ORF Transcript_66275/g.191300 Transcript_66275/m.191300 type:complete len:275 (-) Transcript_66275:1495-2319(-)